MFGRHLFLITNCFFVLFLFSACGEDGGEVKNDLLTLDCGYQYKHHIKNDGPKPQVGEVAYYYFITKADDSLMMNGRDADMISKTQIPQPLTGGQKSRAPISEVLTLMSIGDSVTVMVPLDSIPGLPPGFGNYTNFYYELVLIDIKSKEENSKLVDEERKRNGENARKIDEFSKQIIADYQSGKLDDKLIEKPSGLKYYILEDGNGKIPVEGETVQLRYHALLLEGQSFDSSFPNTPTYPVKVGAGSVVAGWDEALIYLKRGTKAMLFVPSDLGYGDEGNLPIIPQKAELAYYIELVK